MAAPRTWLLLAEKGGDNAQVEALARALPWPCEIRRLRMQPQWLQGKPRVRPTLDHLDLEAGDALEAPWPDLVLTMGRRTASAALWIQERSGGRTRIVLLGKPSGLPDRMALIIGSAEILLPPLPNVSKIRLPLLRMDPDRVAEAREQWRPAFEELARPVVAVLVGGPTHPFVYDASVTQRLLELVREVHERGGTPWVSTSRRTPPGVADALEAGLPEGARLFRWAPEAVDNPYLGLLALAEGFIVTGDSASMLVEVAGLGRPLAILPLPGGLLGRLDLARRRALRWLYDPAGAGPAARLRRALARAAFRLRLVSHSRDFRVLHEWLVDQGHAVWAGQPFAAAGGPLPDDAAAAARRVAALFEDASGTDSAPSP